MTGKSSKNYVVLAATTTLYVANSISGVMTWLQVPLLIGTSGASVTESFVEEFDSFNGSNCVPLKLLTFIPFVVADGLLVRYLSHGINLLLHLIDMAVLQNMERLVSRYRAFPVPFHSRDR